MLVDEDKKIVTEFIMDTNQQYSISLNLTNPEKNIILNSETNTNFFEFNALLKQNNQQIQELVKQLEQTTSEKDIKSIKSKIRELNSTIDSYKHNYIKRDPKNVISLLFKLSQPIESYFNNIENPSILKNRIDSLNYVKNSYFKGIDFSDSRLLRNPFFETKINTYFNSFVIQTDEEITKEIFAILDKTGSRENDVFSYLSLYFMNTYANPKIMGLDRIFINIYNKYFQQQEYSWMSTIQKLSLKNIQRDLKDNLIGNISRNLFMKTIHDERIDLYDVKAPHIVLIFWDPSCGHCLKEIPKIKKIYDDLWKAINIKIFAVNINVDLNEDWKKIIKQENLEDWINVYPSDTVTGNYTQEDVDFQTLFNVHQTPVLYLLDVNKKIIAKQVGVEKYIDIIKNIDSFSSEKLKDN
jgi:thiol-disulfide isomerase/thioredoxin